MKVSYFASLFGKVHQKWHVYIQKFVKFIIKVCHFFSLFGKVHPHPYCFLGRITNNVLLQNTLSYVLSIFQYAHVFIGHFLEKIFFDTWINTTCHYFLKLVFNYLKFRNVIMWWQILHWVSHSQVSKTARITLCFTVKSIIRARLSHNPTSVYVWSRCWIDDQVLNLFIEYKEHTSKEVERCTDSNKFLKKRFQVFQEVLIDSDALHWHVIYSAKSMRECRSLWHQLYFDAI